MSTRQDISARQREWLDRFEHATKGLEAFSFGTCGACDECRDAAGGYEPKEDAARYDADLPAWYFDAEEPSSNSNFGTWYATEEECAAAARAAFDEDVSSGRVPDEGGFSWSECGLCGSRLGGDRYVYHYWYKRPDGSSVIAHYSDGCVDCLMYAANGELPEDANLPPTDDEEQEGD